jgi:dihydrofolate reductase
MKRLILQEFVSLDGLVAGSNDSVDFIPKATQGDRSFGVEQLNMIGSVDTMLLGSVTYRMFAEYWPRVTEGDEKEFADRFNAMPKIVFSRRIDRAPWGKWQEAKVVKTGAVEEVAKLKQRDGKDMIIFGSISVAQSLMNEGLIDEYRLVVCPVVLGNGRPLFREHVDQTEMKLQEAKPFDRGEVLLTYQAANAGV